VTGHIGLRATPGGFATPTHGDPAVRLRIAGSALVYEGPSATAYVKVNGSTLRDLAVFAGTDIGGAFSVGAQTIDLGDVDEPISVDARSALLLGDWYGLGWQILDTVLAGLPPSSTPAVIQLWPEHFDVGTNVGLTSGARVNLGASAGDAYSDDPYLYVGPWGPERPGGDGYWNAPFGAALSRTALLAGSDPLGDGAAFIRTGLQHLQRQEET